MRQSVIALAAAFVTLFAAIGVAGAQTKGSGVGKDSVWSAEGSLSGTGASRPGRSMRALDNPEVSNTVDVPPEAPVTPKKTGAVWKWAAQQVCITTCSGGACDGNQWQTCEGDACPYPGRGCYAVWTGANGAYSQPPGTVAPDGCYSMILTPNAGLCYR